MEFKYGTKQGLIEDLDIGLNTWLSKGFYGPRYGFKHGSNRFNQDYREAYIKGINFKYKILTIDVNIKITYGIDSNK